MESNEQSELTSKTERDSRIESGLTAVAECRGRVSGWRERKKGLMDRDNSVVFVGGRWWGELEEGIRRINGNEKINKKE